MEIPTNTASNHPNSTDIQDISVPSPITHHPHLNTNEDTPEKKPPMETTLSKNQLRKKRRYECAMQVKARKKDQEKAIKIAKAKAQGRDLEKERMEMQERTQLGHGKIKRDLHWQKRLQQAKQSFQVCLDCSFESFMTDKEITSLASQIRYCYAANKNSFQPIFFSVSSLESTSQTWNHLVKVSGFPNQWIPRAFAFSPKSFLEMSFWTEEKKKKNPNPVPTEEQVVSTQPSSETLCQGKSDHDSMMVLSTQPTTSPPPLLPTPPQEQDTQHLLACLPPSNFVYLTSDSETTLQELDHSKIYIIGGIVDRNRLKGATSKKAQELGIATAKLPISQYLHLVSTKVLCCNHVFEILLKYKENGHDWKKAFLDVLPPRKEILLSSEVK